MMFDEFCQMSREKDMSQNCLNLLWRVGKLSQFVVARPKLSWRFFVFPSPSRRARQVVVFIVDDLGFRGPGTPDSLKNSAHMLRNLTTNMRDVPPQRASAGQNGILCLDVLNRGSRFATIRIANGSQRFHIARFESQGQRTLRIAVKALLLSLLRWVSNRAIRFETSKMLFQWRQCHRSLPSPYGLHTGPSAWDASQMFSALRKDARSFPSRPAPSNSISTRRVSGMTPLPLHQRPMVSLTSVENRHAKLGHILGTSVGLKCSRWHCTRYHWIFTLHLSKRDCFWGQKRYRKETMWQRVCRTFGWTFWCDLPQNPCFTGSWLNPLELFRTFVGAVRAIFGFLAPEICVMPPHRASAVQNAILCPKTLDPQHPAP